MANISSPRDNNRVPALIGVSNSDQVTPVQVWADPSTHRLLVDANVSSAAVTGTKSNNAVVPGATNLGTLPAVANAAAPTLTETFQTALSVDLSGNLRTSTSLAANSSVNVNQIGGNAVAAGNGVTGTGSQRVTIASDNTPFAVKIDQTTPGTTNLVALAANQSVNVAQFGGTTVVNGGTAGIQSVGGSTATNVALTENPLNTGGQAVSSENTAVTTARKVQFVADLVGKQIVLPYANPENFVSGVTAAIVDTTNTTVIASAGGSLRNYVTSILVTNSHATVSTLVEIRDGATTVIFRGYALAAGGGFSVTFPVPLRGTAATAVTASCITTGSNVYVSCAGYKGI